jgi:rhodanese-related sulfurtransferase
MLQRLLRGLGNQPSVKTMSAEELHSHLRTDAPPLVLDVRTSEEYAREGHIEGARLLPLATLTQQLHTLSPEQTIVCVCRSGARSATACDLLSSRGFDNAINLTGGMLAWQRAGLPTR